jgi:hypothetical protein
LQIEYATKPIRTHFAAASRWSPARRGAPGAEQIRSVTGGISDPFHLVSWH